MTILVALLISASSVFSAQKEALSPEELLAWFPAGQYFSLSHSDDAAIAVSELYRDFFIFFGERSFFYTHNYHLPALDKRFLSVSAAILLRCRIPTNKDEENDTDYRTGGTLFVIRYDNLDSLIEEALVSKEVTAMEETHLGRPVLNMVLKSLFGREWQYVCWAAPSQELLVAKEIDQLRAMIAAGTGQELNLPSESENVELMNAIKGLGQRWYVYKAPHESRAKYYIMSWEVDGFITIREGGICRSEKTVQEMKDDILSRVNPPSDISKKSLEFYLMKKRATIATIDGTKVMISTKYDANLLKAFAKYFFRDDMNVRRQFLIPRR